MAEIERQVGRITESAARAGCAARGACRARPGAQLFGPAYRSRTIMLLVFHLLQTVGIYGSRTGRRRSCCGGESLGSSLDTRSRSLVSPVGPLLGVLTAGLFERKRSIVVLSTLMAVTGLAFPFARSAVAIVAIGALFNDLRHAVLDGLPCLSGGLFPDPRAPDRRRLCLQRMSRLRRGVRP